MRKKEKIVYRESLLEDLYQISIGNNYAQIISKNRNVKASPIIRQLRLLEKDGYLVSKREKMLNKKIFLLTEKGKKLVLFYNKTKKLLYDLE